MKRVLQPLPSVGLLLMPAPSRACASRGQPIVRRFAASWIGQWPVPPRLQRLQVLAGLEAYGFSWRDVDFRTSARVPPNTGLSRLYRKYSKASQLDPII